MNNRIFRQALSTVTALARAAVRGKMRGAWRPNGKLRTPFLMGRTLATQQQDTPVKFTSLSQKLLRMPYCDFSLMYTAALSESGVTWGI